MADEMTSQPPTVTDTEPLPAAAIEAIAGEVRREREALGIVQTHSPARTQYTPERMRIHVICYEDYDAWILGKFARRLVESLAAFGLEVSLGKSQDARADVNHHIIYYDYLERKSTLETVLITHIDNWRELGKVRRQILEVGVDVGICMSFEALRRLEHFGIPRQRLCFINPAHDGWMKARKLLVGLTTRLYPDGCKREQFLIGLSERISPDEFRFAIMGSGWDAIVATLRQRGFDVFYLDHFHEQAYRALVPTLDYYLYVGRDEGSMGFLDALAAGVPTIVTAQGFHLDVPGGITHSFSDLPELCTVFERIASERRRRIESVSSLTWTEHARSHWLLWDYLSRRQRRQMIPGLLAEAVAALAVG